MTAALHSLDRLVIPYGQDGLYDHPKHAGSRERMAYDVEALEKQVAAGVELRSGAVAALLGVTRGTVHNWIKQGKIRYRVTVGRQRLLNPVDVARLLAETREIHQDGSPEH